MELIKELLEGLKGNERKAMDLGRSTGEAGKPMAKQEVIERNMGPDAWVPYMNGYKEGKRTYDSKNKGRRSSDKTNENLNEGAERAAVKLARTAGKAGKPALSKAAIEKSFGGNDVYKAYMDAYKEAKAEYDRKEEGDAWREKTAAKRQGRHYHE